MNTAPGAQQAESLSGILGKLQTDLGERSTYDAASQCNRCGYCEQACPTYVVTGRESRSGRGRNQIVRMLLEGKLSKPSEARESLSTCMLCGACTEICYAHVATADVVLEGRRMLRAGKQGWGMKLLGTLLEKRPTVLAASLKIANLFRRMGLSRLAAKTHALRILGLHGLEEAQQHVEPSPLTFLFEHLRKDPELQDPAASRWMYFAPCGTNYLYPNVGLATISVLKACAGKGVFLDNPCCGLIFYNYGDLESARRIAKRNIVHYEDKARQARAHPDSPMEDPAVYGDCSSCVAFLKSYPQLFPEDPAWKERAAAFARNVRDIAELEVPDSLRHPPEAADRVWTYHDSCRARNAQGIARQPRKLMRAAVGDAFVEIPEPGWCCGGAGTFAFVQPELSDAVLRRKISRIASVQAGAVATSSTSCLIQIARGLKKYYPECRVFHISELLAARLKRETFP